MVTMLAGWKGCVEVDGVVYDSVAAFTAAKPALTQDTKVILRPYRKPQETKKQTVVNGAPEVRITVKPYMTQPSSPEFDFMARWNNDKPMPMRVMEGVKVKETPGMVYMKLHGMGKPTICCYCCGRELTNPISRHYGIGPICLAKMGIVNEITDVDAIREQLVQIMWEGWIIKSAIIKEEEVDE